MILVFLVDLVTPNQVPFTVCFYVASFSRSLGGGRLPPPPPAGSKLAQTPAGARVKIFTKCMFFGLVEISIEFSTGYRSSCSQERSSFEKSLVKAFKSSLRRAAVRRARDQTLFTGPGSRRSVKFFQFC